MASKLKGPCRGRTAKKCKSASKSCKLTRYTRKRRSYCRRSTSSRRK